MDACPVCQNSPMVPVLSMKDIPVHCNRLHDSRHHALNVPRAELQLGFCPACGHLSNRAFRPELMQYDHRYENSLHFSPRFRQYADELVDRLVDQYQLQNKLVLEIGCGSGEFLQLFAQRGVAHAIGLEPGMSGHGVTGNMEIRPETYGSQHYFITADLICCRHVLEHIADPVAFLQTFRANPNLSASTVFYFEVPNALFTLKGNGYWDLIYEHCSYYSPGSLQRVFENAGFEPIAIYESFGGQFLAIEAHPGKRPEQHQVAEDLQSLIPSFAERFHSRVAEWRNRLNDMKAQHRKIALWGAGSKGITFVNVVDRDHTIESVIDINPRKIGKFIPGTGQPVLSPEELKANPYDVILIMNPLYTSEITETLHELGVTAELLNV